MSGRTEADDVAGDLAPSNDVLPVHLALATVAKVMCSAVFVSGRQVSEALSNSAPHALALHHLDEVLLDGLSVRVDRVDRSLTVTAPLDQATVDRLVRAYRETFPGFSVDWRAETRRLTGLGSASRTARYVESQGCIIEPVDGTWIRFEPVVVRPAASAAAAGWPAAASGPDALARSVRASVGAAVDAAFDDGEGDTAAVVVVHRGRIVGERYRDGIAPDTQLEAWSMGKSLTSTLIGILVQQGHLTLDQPAPIARWQQRDDPRSAITIRDLLQMSSGLRCTASDDSRESWSHGVPDHFYVYSGTLDAFDFATDRPAEHKPGTVGRYRNCDPLALGYVIKQTVTRTLGVDYLTWPQRALFDRLGIREHVLETDLFGNFLLTGFDYGTARGWAKLGLLYARSGVWAGEQILPPWWSEFVSTPAPGWAEPVYGGLFWLNRTGRYELPRDAYYMAGYGEQRVFVVPSADLVVVRMGLRVRDDGPRSSTNRMLSGLMSCLG